MHVAVTWTINFLKTKEFLKIPAAWFAHRVRGIINTVWCLICCRRWFAFSVFFAVATVAREADLSKLAPTTILLFLWLGQKSSIWFLWLKWKTCVSHVVMFYNWCYQECLRTIHQNIFSMNLRNVLTTLWLQWWFHNDDCRVILFLFFCIFLR